MRLLWHVSVRAVAYSSSLAAYRQHSRRTTNTTSPPFSLSLSHTHTQTYFPTLFSHLHLPGCVPRSPAQGRPAHAHLQTSRSCQPLVFAWCLAALSAPQSLPTGSRTGREGRGVRRGVTDRFLRGILNWTTGHKQRAFKSLITGQ